MWCIWCTIWVDCIISPSKQKKILYNSSTQNIITTSATYNKYTITQIQNKKVFVLRYIQARNPEWVQRPFFAHFNDKATWFDQLKPFYPEDAFFFK